MRTIRKCIAAPRRGRAGLPGCRAPRASAQCEASRNAIPTIALRLLAPPCPCSTSPCCARTSPRSSPASRRASRRSPSSTSPRFSALEAERKTIQTRTEELQAQRNALSQADRPAQGARARTPTRVMAEVGGIGDELEGRSAARLDAIQAELQALLLARAEPAARERAGRRRRARQRRGAPLGHAAHVRLRGRRTTSTSARRSGLDFETGAKLSGARFTVHAGRLARLHRALAQFMLDLQTGEHGYTECYTPYIVNARVAATAPASCRSSRTTCSRCSRAATRRAASTLYLIPTSKSRSPTSCATRSLAAERAAAAAHRAHAVLPLRGRQRTAATRAA